jgi:hypothetical protein
MGPTARQRASWAARLFKAATLRRQRPPRALFAPVIPPAEARGGGDCPFKVT